MPRVIVVKEISAVIDKLHIKNVQVTENMQTLSKDYWLWLSTVTSPATTETVATEVDRLATARLTGGRMLAHQAIDGTESTRDRLQCVISRARNDGLCCAVTLINNDATC